MFIGLSSITTASAIPPASASNSVHASALDFSTTGLNDDPTNNDTGTYLDHVSESASPTDMAPEPTESVSAPEENNSTAPGDGSTAMEEADRAVHEQSATPNPSMHTQPSNGQNSIATPLQTRQGCEYATGSRGAYSDTLCWIDFSEVQTAELGPMPLTTRYRDLGGWNYESVLDRQGGTRVHTTGGNDWLTNQAMNREGRYGDIKDVGINVQLDDAHTLTAKLDIRKPGSAGGSRSRYVEAIKFPTYSGAFLGRNGFYDLPTTSSIAPAIYQMRDKSFWVTGQAITEVTLKDIQLHRQNDDGTKTLVRDYSIVVTDAESTNQNESLNWTTTGTPFEWLPNIPGGTGKAQVMGNACTNYSPALNSKSTTASCVGGPTTDRTGTPMLHTAPGDGEFTITTTMTGDGRQGIAFGIITARAQVNVDVEARVLDSNGQPRTVEDFAASMEILDDTTTTTTGTSNQNSTGPRTNTVSGSGNPVKFDTSVTGDHAESYSPSWTCTKTDVEGTEQILWPQSGDDSTKPPPAKNPGDFAWLMPGEFIDCTVTYKPSYLTLAKDVDNGDTDATNGPPDFSLRAEGTAESSEHNAVSVVETDGANPEDAQRFPVTVGRYRLSEDWSDEQSAENWPHGYRWTDLTCRDGNGDKISDTELDIKKSDDGAIEEVTLLMPSTNDHTAAQRDISCTYSNEALQPHLDISKSSDVDAQHLAESGQDVEYTLTFDNSEGTAPIAADHIDHLRDVLDDAHLDFDSITSENLDVEFIGDADTPRLHITGTVGAGQTQRVTYSVTVKSQEEDFEQRERADGPLTGYVLKNFLTSRLDSNGDEITEPEACPDPGIGETSKCATTEDAISAWTVHKESFPVDGARLNYGGNTHYVLSAQKLNDETEISNLQFHDDLTHVFKSAGWDPAAPVPGGAKPRGIYFIDAKGNTLNANGEINGDAAAPQPAYGADAVGEPIQRNGRWILESQIIDNVPTNAVTTQMWFAVEAGQQTNSDIPGLEAWGGQRPATGSKYVNYGFASGSTEPVQCGLPETAPDVSTAPDDAQPADQHVAEACRTQHEVNSGHFTIRKDAVGTGIDVPNGSHEQDIYGDSSNGLWNLVGHEFEIRDDVNGQPSENPSRYLCRVDYRPDQQWDGTFTEHPGDRSLDDWDAGAGDESETLNAIRAWNNDQDNVDDPRYPLPECGVFNPQPDDSGGQSGRYRGMNLQPVLGPDEQGEPRDFWLVETKAPTHQMSLDGSQKRSIPAVQTLAEPIAFTMWPSHDGEHIEGPAFYGKRQLDVRDDNGTYLPRCGPGDPATQRPVACVNATGYLMLVQDTVPPALPLTGGQWLGIVTTIGTILVVIAVIGIGLKRRYDGKTQLS